MAIRVLDIGRCFYLIDKNHNVRYLKYTDVNITPENFVIVVKN